MDFAFWPGSVSQAYPGSGVIPLSTVRIGVFYPFAKSSALKGVCMRKLASLCRRLRRQNFGYYAVVKRYSRYYVYKSPNSQFFPSYLVFEGLKVSEIEDFLNSRFLED